MKKTEQENAIECKLNRSADTAGYGVSGPARI